MVLEVGSPRLGCPHGWVLARPTGWLTDSYLLIVSPHGRKINPLSCVSNICTIPIPEGSTLVTYSPPKGHTSRYHSFAG